MTTILDASAVDAVLDKMFAPWIKALGLKTVATDPQGATFEMPDNRDTVHAGGVVCGQALASAFDTAAVLALSALNGGFRPVTTVDLTAHFIRPVPPGVVDIRAQVESNGKRVAFVRCEARARGSGKLAATATATFMYIGE